MRIFIDKNLVEVFANNRQAVSYAHKQDIRKNPNISLFAKGSDLKVKKVTTWKMKSIYYTDPIHFKPKLPTKKTVGDVMIDSKTIAV